MIACPVCGLAPWTEGHVCVEALKRELERLRETTAATDRELQRSQRLIATYRRAIAAEF